MQYFVAEFSSDEMSIRDAYFKEIADLIANNPLLHMSVALSRTKSQVYVWGEVDAPTQAICSEGVQFHETVEYMLCGLLDRLRSSSLSASREFVRNDIECHRK